jgi:ketosteroid isomerase-like protein
VTDTSTLDPAPAWVRGAGRVVTTRPHAQDSPEVAAARQAAIDTLHRFAWAFDEHDRNSLTACFTEDAVWTATISGHRDLGTSEGRETVLRWLTSGWPAQADQRRHIVTNAVVDELDTDHLDTDHLDTDHLDTDHLDTDHLDTDHLDTDHLDTDHLDTDHLETGASATVTAMILVTAAEGGAFRAVTAGVYRARMRCGGDGVWRIARFDASFDAPF